jgi:hypothetical protein
MKRFVSPTVLYRFGRQLSLAAKTKKSRIQTVNNGILGLQTKANNCSV